MASNRITYPVDTPWGAQIAEFASLVGQTQALGTRIMGALNSMAANGAGPFEELEAELNMQEGDGMALFQTVNVASQQVMEVEVSRIDQGG